MKTPITEPAHLDHNRAQREGKPYMDQYTLEMQQIENDLNLTADPDGPQWSFDCQLKLDFDGPLLNIESRFYPPYRREDNSRTKWSGTLNINHDTYVRNFEGETLDDLHTQVSTFIEKVKELLAPVVRDFTASLEQSEKRS